MGTRKQINLRISGSRVLGRLKKSCKCCGNPDIYAIHLLPTAYPSKKISKFKREEKKKKTSNQFEKNLFPPPFVFCYYFSLTPIFSLSSNLHIKLEKKRNILKEKKNQLTNQEDGTSFPPHKILKHLKDLKILSDPKI